HAVRFFASSCLSKAQMVKDTRLDLSTHSGLSCGRTNNVTPLFDIDRLPKSYRPRKSAEGLENDYHRPAAAFKVHAPSSSGTSGLCAGLEARKTRRILVGRAPITTKQFVEDFKAAFS